MDPVVGLPRTGSKLLRGVLEACREPRVKIADENFFLGRFLRRGVIDVLPSPGALADRDQVARLVDDMFEGRFWGAFWERLAAGEMGVDRAQLVRLLMATDRTPRAIYETLLRLPVSPAVEVVGDKTGPHLYHVPRLLEWFPQAKVVHTFRDPRAILASESIRRARMARQGKGRPGRQAELLLGRSELAVRLLVLAYVTVAWLRAARLHDAYRRDYASHYRLSVLEQLVADPDRHLDELGSFLGLPLSLTPPPPKVDSSYVEDAPATGFDAATTDRWRESLPVWMRAWITIATRHRFEDFGFRP